jgi:medium-chain acyl-[acyl-carrier-protein] hydrolase
MTNRAWLAGQQLSPHADLLLFCLPYAGGGAYAYRTWRETAPPHLQVCPLELPGRGRRLAEAPFLRMDPLARSMAEFLAEVIDRPYALFGHSMGGLVAFEVARKLRSRGLPAPEHLFVSAMSAPDVPRSGRVLHSAPDEEVKQHLLDLGGTPRELLDDRDLMELMLPTLRADFCVLETYEYRAEPPLPTPITVFAGTRDDAISNQDMSGWRRQTRAAARLQMFPGDHFFLQSRAADVLRSVVTVLGRPSSGPDRLDPDRLVKR